MKQIITILLSLTYALTAGAQHAVDLGLSVNWADRNIGANRPEEAGIYVAWGELEPKDTYTLDNYRFGDGNFFSPNKYIVETGESQTETDHKRILDDTDDIATVTLGDGWRMPTYTEIGELAEKCQWKWDETKKGYTVTGPNGNSIFIPATGYYNEDTLYSGDTEGYYWSNELDPYQTDYARTLRFTPRIVHHQNFYEAPRDMGLAVRAVSPRP
jgi:hypothetical protein